MNRLITFEGIDGCGKSTQIRLISERFQDLNLSPLTVRDPGTTRISEKIRSILLDRENLDLAPISEPLLFLAARAQMTHQLILPNLNKGNFVLCDRYIDSTLAYQGYGRNLDLVALRTLNYFATQGYIPELTFLLDISPDISHSRRQDVEDDRMEAGGMQYLAQVRQGYIHIAREEPHRVQVVAGERDPAVIADEIWQIILDRYKDQLFGESQKSAEAE